MYSKCHMSLTMEMYLTHEISDIIGNVQEMSGVLDLGNVHEMQNF